MQNLSKINSRFTTQVVNKDHPAWHQGIERYGFWAIIIRDKYWQNAFAHAREYVGDFVLPNYRRAPHITLSACGLISEAHFSTKALSEQIKKLKSLQLKPFRVEQLGLDSFEAAPFISIKTHPKLSQIRETLESISQDNPAKQYRPHITLGFYNEAHEIAPLKESLRNYVSPLTSPLIISHLSYCSYQTNSIQGEIKVELELTLADD